jgi:very-short-patch-repair endonuclease
MGKVPTFAKHLRRSSTDTEKCLWRYLRAKRFRQLKFRRQQPIGRYIVDFVCFEKRLIVECDGSQHVLRREKDRERDNWFERQGYRVLRFWDKEVFRNSEAVLQAIWEACQRSPSP